MNRITDSRHVSFDESEFLGALDVKHVMEDEISDDKSSSGYDEIQKELAENHYKMLNDDTAIYKFFNVDQINPDDTVPESSSSDDVSTILTGHNDDNYDDGHNNGVNNSGEDGESNVDINEFEDENKIKFPRYPRQHQKSPGQWYIASTVQLDSQPTVTISEDSIPPEAMRATAEERSLWESTILEEIQSLDDKYTWERDDNPKCKPFPTHIVKKFNGNLKRFKGRFVAARDFQALGENFLETYDSIVFFSLIHILL